MEISSAQETVQLKSAVVLYPKTTVWNKHPKFKNHYMDKSLIMGPRQESA